MGVRGALRGGDVHTAERVPRPRSRTQENRPVSQWDFVRKAQGAAGPGLGEARPPVIARCLSGFLFQPLGDHWLVQIRG